MKLSSVVKEFEKFSLFSFTISNKRVKEFHELPLIGNRIGDGAAGAAVVCLQERQFGTIMQKGLHYGIR